MSGYVPECPESTKRCSEMLRLILMITNPRKRGRNMSKFAKFMKENKIVRENEKYAPTRSLMDEGKPLLWEFRHITSKENEEIRENCTMDVQVTGKPNIYRPRLDSRKYMSKLIAASVVYPDLLDKELQDSYGVMTPEELLFELVNDAGEYQDLAAWVQAFQGFGKSMNEKVDEAKN